MKAMIVSLALLFACSWAMGGTVSLYAENDLTYQTDRYYTHGTRLTYADGGREYFLGQNMYTPSDKKATEVVEDDRPYAGWLYVGMADLSWIGDVYNILEGSVGVVGPSSLAHQSQDTIHGWVGSGLAQGWGNQLEDEPALLLRDEVRRSYRVASAGWLAVDLVPQADVCVGTVMDYVGVGGDVMFGYNPDPAFRSQILPRGFSGKRAAYAFVGVRGRAVAWNIFLDGNMWHDSPSVEKEPLVGEAQAGACLACGRFAVSYVAIVKSKEFETQEDVERFSSVSLAVSW